MKRSGQLLAVFLLVISILGFLVYRAHWRVVTEGEFFGLTIGDTKQKTFDQLLERNNVSLLAARVPEFIVTKENIDQLEPVLRFAAVLVEMPFGQLVVHNEAGKINHLRKNGSDKFMEKNWDTIAEMEPDLRNLLLSTNGTSVRRIPKRPLGARTYQVSASFSDPPSSQDREWLFSFDQWAFYEDDRWTFIDLYFSGGRLGRIEFKNNFVEMP